MPNWCSNTLTITGDEELIKKFHDENKDDDEDEKLSFYKSVPLYDDYDDDDFEHDGGDDDMKRITMWGTKWDACEVCTDEMGEYEFETAWNPPKNWFRAIVQKYPELHFELLYSEIGMDFSGVIKAQDGEIYVDDEGRYGEYDGHFICEYCCDLFPLNDICTDYYYNVCYNCLKESEDVITDAVRNIKKKRLPFKNACNRISRNPIFDQYLLRKVFVKRVSEIF